MTAVQGIVRYHVTLLPNGLVNNNKCKHAGDVLCLSMTIKQKERKEKRKRVFVHLSLELFHFSWRCKDYHPIQSTSWVTKLHISKLQSSSTSCKYISEASAVWTAEYETFRDDAADSDNDTEITLTLFVSFYFTVNYKLHLCCLCCSQLRWLKQTTVTHITSTGINQNYIVGLNILVWHS